MQVFNVEGMTCGHCVKAVTGAIQAQDAGAVVEVDLGRKEVKVQSSLKAQEIESLIREEGYEVKAA